MPKRPELIGQRVQWSEISGREPVEKLPQICWADGRAWSEANLWALNQATSGRKHIKTVTSAMNAVHGYAKWLEQEDVAWWHFPQREADRCLNRYRGALIKARDAGELAASTCSSRMSTVIRLYRWLAASRLLSPHWPMWSDRQVGIRLTDAFGFEHTLSVTTSDLAIPNRKIAGAVHVEDGLLPVSIDAMHRLLAFAETATSEELRFMLRLGFQSGLRLGSICDLDVRTLSRALRDPVAGWYRLEVGPGAKPAVQTKFGITGCVPIPEALLEELCAYATSTRRLKRQALALPIHRNALFLNSRGRPYSEGSINVAMSRLRDAGHAAGVDVVHDFYFHRTRATFATELMRAALRVLPVSDAITLVRDACLHKSETTTMMYVRFLETTQAMREAADAFTVAMMGLAQGERAVA